MIVSRGSLGYYNDPRRHASELCLRTLKESANDQLLATNDFYGHENT